MLSRNYANLCQSCVNRRQRCVNRRQRCVNRRQRCVNWRQHVFVCLNTTGKHRKNIASVLSTPFSGPRAVRQQLKTAYVQARTTYLSAPRAIIPPANSRTLTSTCETHCAPASAHENARRSANTPAPKAKS